MRIARIFYASRSLTLSVTLFVSVSLALPATAESTFKEGEMFVEGIHEAVNHLNTDGLLALLNAEPDLELIDVRLPEEIAHQGGTIDAGRRTHVIPRGWIEFRTPTTIPDADTPIVVYCSTNRRSPLAAHVLTEMGYRNVYNYSDGFPGWLSGGYAVDATDEAVGSALFRLPMKVTEDVYSAIGATAPPTYENSGHNNNLSFVITSDGVLVVNAGDNYLLAQALHTEIKKLTDQPVKYVVLENGQGHAMLGMNYWQEQGAQIIAHTDTADEIELHGEQILQRMQTRNRDKSMGTELSVPDLTFEDEMTLTMGDTHIVLLNLGPAHSPGDSMVWLPEKEVIITGDMAFHERLLPVFDDTDTQGWVDTWAKFEALNANIVVPGHGHVTDMATVKEWTYDYLVYMRDAVNEILDNGGSLLDAYSIDQSKYAHLDTFDELAVLNADRIYRAMEFE